MFDKFRNEPYKHGVFTNLLRDETEKTLVPLGLEPRLFSYMLTNEDFSKPKPDPAGFEKMIHISGVLPENILYVGDIEMKDVHPAKALGIRTALVGESPSEADIVVQKVTDVYDALAKI